MEVGFVFGSSTYRIIFFQLLSTTYIFCQFGLWRISRYQWLQKKDLLILWEVQIFSKYSMTFRHHWDLGNSLLSNQTCLVNINNQFGWARFKNIFSNNSWILWSPLTSCLFQVDICDFKYLAKKQLLPTKIWREISKLVGSQYGQQNFS